MFQLETKTIREGDLFETFPYQLHAVTRRYS